MRRGFWWKNLKESSFLEDLDVGGEIILNWIIQKYNKRVGLEEFGSR
jgi:hypothetical protein